MNKKIKFEDIKYKISYVNNCPEIFFFDFPAPISKIQIDLDLPIVSYEDSIDLFKGITYELKLVRKKLKELDRRNSTTMVEQLRKNAREELRSLEAEYAIIWLSSYENN